MTKEGCPVFDSLFGSESKRAVLALGVWTAAVFGVLQVHHLPALTEHSICSPAWGCGPPVNALLSYHGFWLVVFAAPTVFAVRWLPSARLRQVGVLLVSVGGIAIAGIVIWQAMDWLPRADDFQRQFFVQRCLFKLAIMVDLPAMQTLLAGLVCLVSAGLEHRRATGATRHRSSRQRSTTSSQHSEQQTAQPTH